MSANPLLGTGGTRVEEPAPTAEPSPPNRPGTSALGHATNGRFLPGNTDARKHGLRQSRFAEETAAARAEFAAMSTADDGGATDMPTRRRSLHEYRARLHVSILALSDALESFGLFDKRGRLRTGWLQRLEGLIATAQRVDGVLGLDRKARAISLTETLIAAAAARRAQQDRDQDAPPDDGGDR